MQVFGRRVAGFREKDECFFPLFLRLSGDGHARPICLDDLLDVDVHAGPAERDAGFGWTIRIGITGDEEQRRHCRRRHESHDVTIQLAVGFIGLGCGEGAVAIIANVIAFHHRGIRIHVEIPVRIIAPKQVLSFHSVDHDLRIGQPAMAVFLAHDLERAV